MNDDADRGTPLRDWIGLCVYSTIYTALVVAFSGTPWADDWFASGSLSFELAKGIPAAFIAAVAGAVASLIAYRQWKTADQQRRISAGKLNLDLFEERYKLFELLWSYLSARVGGDLEGTIVAKTTTDLQNAQHKYYFMFGEDIGAFVQEAYRKGLKQGIDLVISKGDPRDPTALKGANSLSGSYIWFHEQIQGLRPRFAAYLDFGNWR